MFSANSWLTLRQSTSNAFFPSLNHIKAGFEGGPTQKVTVKFKVSLFSWLTLSLLGCTKTSGLKHCKKNMEEAISQPNFVLQKTSHHPSHWGPLEPSVTPVSHRTHSQSHPYQRSRVLSTQVMALPPWRSSTFQSLGISSHSLALWLGQPLFPWITSLPPTFSNAPVSIGLDRFFSNLKK